SRPHPEVRAVSRENWARIGRCLIDSRARFVLWHDSAWHPFPSDLASPLQVTDAHVAAARATQPLASEPQQFLVPLDPPKVIGVGLNYRSHAIEVGAPIPKNPLLFAKFNTGLIGHGATIHVDESVTQAPDWEVELAVIVGRTLRRASRAEAENAVFGYTV